MRHFLCISLVLSVLISFAQVEPIDYRYQVDSIDWSGLDSLWIQLSDEDYEPRYYNLDNCACPLYSRKPGEPVPDFFPYARFSNDTSLWQWRTIKLGDRWEYDVYEIKPQYKDTLITYDGRVVDVPMWIKYPGWTKPEEE